MEHNKDIGTVVQETLDQGSMSPQASLWERLDTSLEARKKKRRRALWFWYSSAGILLVMLVAIWGVSNNSTPKDNSITPITSEMVLDTNSVGNIKSETHSASETDTKDDERSLGTIENKPDEIYTTVTPENTQVPEFQKIETTRRKKISAEKKKKEKNTEGYKVTTKHLYYNSDADTTVVSTNKQVIDSLVQANKRIMAIKDSIARARAADSIKLNSIITDSLPKN